jgi:membrane protein
MDRLTSAVTTAMPGGAGELIGKTITEARDKATGIGIISLVLVLFTGTGWVANLRTAAQEMWGVTVNARNFVLEKLSDLVTLVGLGLTMLVSIGLSAAASSVTLYLVKLAGLSHIPGASILTRIIAIAAAMLADIGMFYYVIRVLPRQKVPFRAVFSGALLGAVAMEILKFVATYYLPKVASSPAAGIFGTFVVLLIWINFMARIMLFAVTWTATSPTLAAQQVDESPAATAPPVQLASPRPASPGAAAAVLIAAGAVVGALIPRAVRRWWNGAT